MFNRRKSLKYIVIFSVLAISATTFQNCAPVEVDDSQAAKSSTGSSNGSSSTIPIGIDDDGNLYQAVSIIGTASNSTGVDCSRADATLQWEIRNADASLRICQEFSLTAVNRYGETHTCDSDSKFVTPYGAWTYDKNARVYRSGVVNLKNHSHYVPGSFWIAAKDAQGNIVRSNKIAIVKDNASNCLAEPACSWSGTDFSPADRPTHACTTANNGERWLNANKVYYTCSCSM